MEEVFRRFNLTIHQYKKYVSKVKVLNVKCYVSESTQIYQQNVLKASEINVESWSANMPIGICSIFMLDYIFMSTTI